MVQHSLIFFNISVLSKMAFSTLTKHHITTSIKPLSQKSSGLNHHLWYYLSTCIFTKSDPETIGSSTDLICMYLGIVSPLIWFTPWQPFGWTWGYPATLQQLKLKCYINPPKLPRKCFFVCKLCIISWQNISSVSTDCSRAILKVGIHPPYYFFLVLFSIVYW